MHTLYVTDKMFETALYAMTMCTIFKIIVSSIIRTHIFLLYRIDKFKHIIIY